MSPHYSAVEWVGDSTIYLGGLYSTIMRSDDAGRSWRYLYQRNPARQAIWDIHFFDDDNGIAVVDDGHVLATSDGGVHWSATRLPGRSTSALAFATDRSGVVVGDSGLIAKTDDRGVSWTKMASGTSERLLGVAFADSLSGIVVGEDATILRTADGGASWSAVHLDTSLTRYEGTVNYFRGVDLRGDAGVIVGYSSRMRESMILHSSDRGATWARAQSDGLPLHLHSVRFVDRSRVIVGGNRARSVDPGRARTAVSLDEGRTWRLSDSIGLPESDVGYTIRDAAFAADGLRGVVCGEQGSCFLTSDGGITWSVRQYLPLESGPYRNDLPGVVGLDAETAVTFVAGEGNWPVRTTDRGLTWRAEPKAPFSISGFDFFDTARGIATLFRSTGNGKLYEISEAGRTWTLIDPQFDRASFENTTAPLIIDSRTGYFGAGNMLFNTSDAGASWHTVSTFTGAVFLAGVQFISRDVGFAIPLALSTGVPPDHVRALHRTDDGGATWRPLMTRHRTPQLSAVRFLDDRRGFVVAGSSDSQTAGTLYGTRDGGVTWDSVQLGGWPRDIRFFGDSLGFIVGHNALVMKTTDRGETWQRIEPWPHAPEDSTIMFRHVDLMEGTGSSTLLIAGYGELLRAELDWTSGMPTLEDRSVRAGVDASVVVVPNPSSDARRRLVLHRLPASAVARVTVYDSYGRLVSRHEATIRGERDEAIPFDAGDLAAGVYRVVIESHGFRAGVQVVVVR